MIDTIKEYIQERDITKVDFARRIKMSRNSFYIAINHNKGVDKVISALRKNDPELYKIILARKRRKNETPKEHKSGEQRFKERCIKLNRVNIFYGEW